MRVREQVSESGIFSVPPQSSVWTALWPVILLNLRPFCSVILIYLYTYYINQYLMSDQLVTLRLFLSRGVKNWSKFVSSLPHYPPGMARLLLQYHIFSIRVKIWRGLEIPTCTGHYLLYVFLSYIVFLHLFIIQSKDQFGFIVTEDIQAGPLLNLTAMDEIRSIVWTARYLRVK